MCQIKVLFVLIIGIIPLLQSCENQSDDPRDPFIGSYRCKVVYKNTLDPSHAMYSPDTIYYSTLDVSKHDNSSILQISGDMYVKIELDFTDFTFNGADFPGQRLGGKFYSDSIYLTTWITSAGFIRWTYTGKRIS